MPPRQRAAGRDNYLTRPRFLAISEFGPLSLIYHEGSQYRVKKVILSVNKDQMMGQTGLATEEARLCPECGYGHFRQQLENELCQACHTKLDHALRIHNLYRVENVSTRRAYRITSDEEERTRQGYDIQTTVQFAEIDGELRVSSAQAMVNHVPLLNLQYAPAATVWRVNLGWRRRKAKTIHGFNINATTGFWSKDEQAPGDVNDDAEREERLIQRISPYVEDRRNVLIIRPSDPWDESGLTTLQYALKRGIEQVFQIEEAELVAEPLPNRETRNAILFYEAAEGGAGVLTRLASDRHALAGVAERALELCHYETTDEWRTIENNHDECEAGCYRCLLSYYNQPDHERIDRQHNDAIEILKALTRATVESSASHQPPSTHSPSKDDTAHHGADCPWLQYVKQRQYRQPDESQLHLEAFDTRPDYLYREHQAVVYIDHSNCDESLTRKLQDAGLLVIRFPPEPTAWDDIFAQYPDVFGVTSP